MGNMTVTWGAAGEEGETLTLCRTCSDKYAAGTIPQRFTDRGSPLCQVSRGLHRSASQCDVCATAAPAEDPEVEAETARGMAEGDAAHLVDEWGGDPAEWQGVIENHGFAAVKEWIAEAIGPGDNVFPGWPILGIPSDPMAVAEGAARAVLTAGPDRTWVALQVRLHLAGR